MSHPLSILNFNVVIDCNDAKVLATFYSRFIGWEWTHKYTNGWAAITSPTGTIIAFQEIENYQAPTWPPVDGIQTQMLHLDFHVDNLKKAVQHAIECGAHLADVQYFKTSRTMLDPAGHPFCLDTNEAESAVID